MNMATTVSIEKCLRVRIEELEEEIRQLRTSFAPKIDWPLSWGLSRSRRMILSALWRCQPGGYVTREQLLHVIVGVNSEVGIKIVDVHITALRRNLSPRGIYIETIWGVGLALTSDSRAKLALILEEHRQ